MGIAFVIKRAVPPPPDPHEANFQFEGGYTPPEGDDVDFLFTDN